MRAAAARLPEGLPSRVSVIDRDRQRDKIGSDRCHGGGVHQYHAPPDAGRYHAGLPRPAGAAGVQVAAQTLALSLTAEEAGVRVVTPRGTIRAGDAVRQRTAMPTGCRPGIGGGSSPPAA